MLIETLARFAAACSLAKPTIALLTAVTAANFSAVLLYLHSRTLRDERWAQFLGWAFGLFTLQYLIQLAGVWGSAVGLSWKLLLPAPQVAQTLCSPANNLCILAAARVLLRRKTVLPIWIAVLALLTAVAELGPEAVWSRLPDSLLSLFCLGNLGWAMYRNLTPKKRPVLASFNGIMLAPYGVLNVVYAFNPWFANEATGSHFLVELQTRRQMSPLFALDSLVFALAFVFKIALFIAALLLIIRSLLIFSPEPIRRLLNLITNGRGRYLRPEGILRALGESTEADLVALCMRSPETERERVVWMRWLKEPPTGMKSPTVETISLPPAEKSIVAWILRGGEPEVTLPDLERNWGSQGWDKIAMSREEIERNRDIKRRYFPFVPGMKSFVTVPIRYHGAVIAALNFEWKEANGYSATTVQRVHQMAALLAPTVHRRRELMAINVLTSRFRATRLRSKNGGVVETLTRLVADTHTILSPLATVCIIDLGFRWYHIGHTDQASRVSSSTFDENMNMQEHIKSVGVTLQLDRQVIQWGRLAARDQDPYIGKLIMVIGRKHDEETRPSLVCGNLHRRVIAALLADAVLDVIRGELRSVLDNLQLKLNLSAVSTVEAWHSAIAQASTQAGLLWAVARLPEAQDSRPIGGDRERALILDFEPNLSDEPIQLFGLSQPWEETYNLLALPLKASGGVLWLGLGRRRFSSELKSFSPWRDFLLRTAQIAGSALVRIEKQALQIKTKRFETVAKRVETTGFLMHTLGNDANALLLGMQSLEDLISSKKEAGTEDLRDEVEGLLKSAEHFKRIANAFKHNVPSDSRLVIPLKEPLSEINVLYGESFREHGIKFIAKIPDDLMVAVPLDAAYIALVTVVINAAQAIDSSTGTIRVEADRELDAEGRIVCRIIDTGPGISENLHERIFDPDFTTKRDGTGHGLGLARESLRRSGGDLVLEDGTRGATTFALHLPQPRSL